MVTPIWRLTFSELNDVFIPLVRYRHFLRGKPPGIAKSLEQRLREENKEEPTLDCKVNIGFTPSHTPVQLKDRLEHYKKQNTDAKLEKLARLRQLHVSLDDVKRDWNDTLGPTHIKTVAEHYGVFEHLFGDAYFIPVIPLDIVYQQEDSKISVHRGNIIKPCEASQPPEVKFATDEDSLWTLILTNPDGNFTDNQAECVHWFIGNIPGSEISRGDLIYDYLQPFPPRGIGFQRLIFILYKQEQKINYESYKKPAPCRMLSERNFKTKEFYRTHEDELTPAGLAFFQSDWDPSLTNFFHKCLEMKEPVYEYDFPKPYIKPQVWFPKRQPFNLD